jgi:hypothetical protein
MLVGATTAAMAIAGLCGCAAALPDMAGLAQPGNLVTGLMAVRSTAELNRANEQLARAQAELTKQQALDLKNRREELKDERPVTVGILKDMAGAEHQPIFNDLALWVAAGGDPNYALNYALSHQGPPAPRDRKVKRTAEIRPAAEVGAGRGELLARNPAQQSSAARHYP